MTKQEWRNASIRKLQALKRSLVAGGFEASSVRFNPGGPAVSGEATLYARGPAGSVFVMTLVTPWDGMQILYRYEDWPGGKGHKRSGRNRYHAFTVADQTLATSVILAASERIIG